jgi:hypothetical protein
VKTVLALLLLALSALGANPYLDLKDDQPVAAPYTGTEWGDEIEAPTEEGAPLRAEVTMQRLATMPWGQVVRITFVPKGSRTVQPLHLLVTDHEILELASETMDREVKAISEMKQQPRFEKSDVRALSRGSLTFEDAPWSTKVTVKDGVCTFLASHPSGHFTKFVWKKGAGLVEYAQGQGARADGFRLKATKAPQKPAKK